MFLSTFCNYAKSKCNANAGKALTDQDLTLFRMGFSPCNFTNVGVSPQNFLTFSFDPFATRCQISSLYLVPVPNY